MSRSLLLPAGLTVLAMLVASPDARADGSTNPSKHECVEASEAGQDLQQAGKLREARSKLAVCIADTCPGPVREDCAARLAAVDRAVPSIVFEAKDGAGNDLTAVRVTLDGRAIAERLNGSAIDIDPGEHRFTFEVAGQPTVERKLVIRERDKERRERVIFGVAAPAPPTVATQVAPSPGAPTTPPEDGGQGRRVLGLVAGGVGLVGLAVGGIFGGLTFSSWGNVNSECPNHAGCSAQATNNHSNAVTFGTVSTAGFIAGGVLLAGGVTLYFTAPGDRSPSVGIQMAPGGLGVAGRF